MNKNPGKILLGLLHKQPVISIGSLFMLALIVVLWDLHHVSQALTRDAALRYAEHHMEALDLFRSAYSSEVVSRATHAGVEVAADYRMHDDKIPFPATLSLFLAREINASHSGIKANIYSDHPWPWRADGGPQNEFERSALQALQNNPDQPHSVIENVDGIRYLHFAEAIVMDASCVDCHNSHPQSPKRGWKTGDVRGAQSISLPLPTEIAVLKQYLGSTAAIMLISAVLLLTLLALVIRALNASIKEVQRYADETKAANLALTRTNTTFARFVPHEFLGFLRKEKIIDIKLGDNAQKEMTILFSDIRDFTTLSERLSPEDNFNFINNYLSTMGPVVREHGGFIDKYIGDAIMALFDNPDTALSASVEMLRRLDGFNKKATHTGGIRIGIGLNTGHIMLGTIGEANRMEGTVISDAVNLASRIEGLTKQFRAPLLISDTTLRRLKNPNTYHIRLIGCSRVKGKTEVTTLYEVFDADAEPLRKAKQETRKVFAAAVKLYLQGKYTEAAGQFQRCLDHAPDDLAAEHYLDECKNKQD